MATLKVDSNITGLALAEEQSIGVLPTTPVWRAQEPNSYKEFGGQVSLTARNPIVASRQQKKGSVTDLSAGVGFTSDLSHDSHIRPMQGFFFADAHQKAGTAPFTGTQVAVSGVDATTYTIGADVGIKAGDLVLGSGFGKTQNNGLKLVTAVTGTTVVTSGCAVEASPPAGAALRVVGFQFAAGDLTVDVSGSLPRLARSGGSTKSLTDFGLVPGEWIYIGGDAAATEFANASNAGFARVSSVDATGITLDKTLVALTTDAGTSKTIQLFFGTAVKNEATANLIKRRTYNVERTLGSDNDGVVSEYVIGAVPNEMVLTMKAATKVECEMSFLGITAETRTGAQGVKSGTRIAASASDCFNTASDFSRIRMATVSSTSSAPTPLVGYIMDATLTIKNSVSANKALGVLGAFDMTAGNFEMEGKLTCYFSDVSAMQAIRSCADVTLDIVLTKKNAGLVFDLPLLALGEGRLTVAKDKPVELPLSASAAQSSFGHTALVQHFSYLPTVAAP